MSTLPPDATPPPGAGPVPGPPPGAVPPPPPPPPGPPAPPAWARRPPAVVAAVLLMVPTALTWLAAGVSFFVAMARAEGDGKFLLMILAVLVFALCLLLVVMTVSGMYLAWRRRGAEGLALPATFTLGLFVIVLVGLLVQGKLSYQPTMVTPLVVGGLSGVALALLKSRPARDWFAGRQR